MVTIKLQQNANLPGKNQVDKISNWIILVPESISDSAIKKIPYGQILNQRKKQLKKKFAYACKGLEIESKADELLDTSIANFYEGIREREVDNSNVMAARSRIEKDPAYSKVCTPSFRYRVQRGDGLRGNRPLFRQEAQNLL